MVFSSAIFLFVFLPVVFILNFFIKNKYSNIFLLLASLIFYAWGEPIMVLLMAFSIILNWFLGRKIGNAYSLKTKKILLSIGIICDLGILGYYKYAGFLVSIINSIFSENVINDPKISLPIGISFFTFQAMSYLIDVYRNDVDASPQLINTALYISFFPQLIAGPIVKYKDINKQIENRNITYDGVTLGFKRFIYGLAKKVLISNVMGMCADIVYSYDVFAIDSVTAWIGALAYTFQIYYDFSGYSDMAIGLGKMFGFDILENFNYPYLSKSISEFWRRWHISLGSWFREYLYIPLGGNRKGKIRTYINLFIVFFCTGLWHGASFSFVFWGLYHGFFSIIERLGLKKFLDKHKYISWIYCFSIVNFGWALFRAADIAKVGRIILRMITPWRYSVMPINMWNYIDYKTIFVGLCAILGMGLLQIVVPKKIKEKWSGSCMEAIYCCLLLIICLASIASDTYNPFIYFQF